MPCGCQSAACGCEISGGDGVAAVKVGNTLVVDLVLDPADTPVPLSKSAAGLRADLEVTDGDTVDLDVSAGELTAEVILDPAPTGVALSSSAAGLSADVAIDPADTAVTLTTSAAGLSAELDIQDGDTVDLDISGGELTAEVIIDPASTADVTSSNNGLRVDIPASGITPDPGSVVIESHATAQAPAPAGAIISSSGRIVRVLASNTYDLPPAVSGYAVEVINESSPGLLSEATIDTDGTDVIVNGAPVGTATSVRIPGRTRYLFQCRTAGQWWVSQLNVPDHPTVPSLPFDGMEFNYVLSSTDGTVWKFRYRDASASSYKWEFVGGTPFLENEDTTTSTSNTGYTTIPSFGGFVTPSGFDGDWRVQIGAWLSQSVGGGTALVSYDVGASAATDGRGVEHSQGPSDTESTEAGSYSSPPRVWTGLAAGTLIVPRYRAAGGGFCEAGYLWMTVIPIRVG